MGYRGGPRLPEFLSFSNLVELCRTFPDVIWEYVLILSSLSADQPTALCLGDLDLEYFCTYLSRAA